MTTALVIAISQVPTSGAAVGQPAVSGYAVLTGFGEPERAAPVHRSGAALAAVAAPERCSSVQRAIKFYSRRVAYWRDKMGAGDKGAEPQGSWTFNSSLPCPRYLAHALQRKSYATRTRAEMWIAEHVLSDFRVMAGARAWYQAVTEAQKPYPGTSAWLLSCSASEGGWGRWVPNSQGSGVGGWLQFHPSTFAGFSWHARVHAARRGYIVPGSASSWYSPLGQALAGAWGITHGMRSHWAGSGCR